MKPKVKFIRFTGRWICSGQVNGLLLQEGGATVGEAVSNWYRAKNWRFAP